MAEPPNVVFGGSLLPTGRRFHPSGAACRLAVAWTAHWRLRGVCAPGKVVMHDTPKGLDFWSISRA